MCRPHGTAFLPPDVCRRKERKGKQERKERKERKARKKSKKERKAKNSHTPTGYPSLSSSLSNHRIIEPNQPPDHPCHLLIFIFSSPSSKNPTISMLNSNLAYQKKRVSKKPKYITYTNNQVCQVYPGIKSTQKKTYTSPDNDHVHTPNSRRLSAPQSFRLRRDNMSNEDKVPTSLSQHNTQTH